MEQPLNFSNEKTIQLFWGVSVGWKWPRLASPYLESAQAQPPASCIFGREHGHLLFICSSLSTKQICFCCTKPIFKTHRLFLFGRQQKQNVFNKATKTYTAPDSALQMSGSHHRGTWFFHRPCTRHPLVMSCTCGMVWMEWFTVYLYLLGQDAWKMFQTSSPKWWCKMVIFIPCDPNP